MFHHPPSYYSMFPPSPPAAPDIHPPPFGASRKKRHPQPTIMSPPTPTPSICGRDEGRRETTTAVNWPPTPQSAQETNRMSPLSQKFPARCCPSPAPSVVAAVPRSEQQQPPPSPPDYDQRSIKTNSSSDPEITEVSTAATIRLLHKVAELRDVVGLWDEFRAMDTNCSGSDYLARCYIGEMLCSWRNLQRGFNDIARLRASGNGTESPTRFEQEIAEVLGKVNDWRNRNMPRRPAPPPPSCATTYSPCFGGGSSSSSSSNNDRRSALPSHWVVPSAGCSRAGSRRRPHGMMLPPSCVPRCNLAPAVVYGPCRRDCDCRSCSGTPPSPVCGHSPFIDARAEESEQRRLRALGLADTISSAVQNFELTRKELDEEIGSMRKNLLKSQMEWIAKRAHPEMCAMS